MTGTRTAILSLWQQLPQLLRCAVALVVALALSVRFLFSGVFGLAAPSSHSSTTCSPSSSSAPADLLSSLSPAPPRAPPNSLEPLEPTDADADVGASPLSLPAHSDSESERQLSSQPSPDYLCSPPEEPLTPIQPQQQAGAAELAHEQVAQQSTCTASTPEEEEEEPEDWQLVHLLEAATSD